MKKLLALILSALMLFSVTACNTVQSGMNDGGDNAKDIENSNDSTNTTDISNNKIDISKITSGTIFSEGKAWVRCGEFGSEEYYFNLYCINKSGEILFTLSDVSGNDPSPFYNGLSMVSFFNEDRSDRVWCICDENGNITKPSDVGADEFLYNRYDLFEDGYIFAKKTDASFSGSSVTAAIFNPSLEVIAEYSEDIFELYEKYEYSSYYNGYLYVWNEYTDISEHSAFDLKSGQEILNISDFTSLLNPEYASDLWLRHSIWEFSYRNKFTLTETLDLSEYRETIAAMYYFENGTAPLVFESADKLFFTILNDDGSFCFEPVEILACSNNVDVLRSNGKYLVISRGSKYTFETFDTNGKIAESENLIARITDRVKICDDVIIVYGTNTAGYYSLEFEPLF